jgi:hypothetical protein
MSLFLEVDAATAAQERGLLAQHFRAKETVMDRAGKTQ